MFRRFLAAGAVLAAVFAVPPEGRAADMAQMPDPGPALHGDATFYLWGPSIGGELGIDGFGPYDIPDDSDTSLEDFLKAFNGAFMGTASLRYGNWGVMGDVVWADFGNGSNVADDFVRSRSNVSGLVGTAALTYTLVDVPQASLEVLAGARVWSVDAGLKLTTTGDAFDVDLDKNISWVDPLIGLRGHYSLSEDFFASGVGAIGGFGVGSEFMWDTAATLGYNFNENFAVQIGYRALGTNYRQDGDVIDIVAHGPVFGLTGRF